MLPQATQAADAHPPPSPPAPVEPVSLILSLPARSTRCSLERRKRRSAGMVYTRLALTRCSITSVTMACERLLSEFIL